MQRTQLVIWLRAKENWPIGVGDFRDIDVTARIQRDAVGSDELAQSLADRLGAEMGTASQKQSDRPSLFCRNKPSVHPLAHVRDARQKWRP